MPGPNPPDKQVRCVSCGKETTAYSGDNRYLGAQIDKNNRLVQFEMWSDDEEKVYGSFKAGDVVCAKCRDRVNEGYWRIEREPGYYNW